MAKMEIIFKENKKINALFKGFEIKTDQPSEYGGNASAPTPYDLFLASLGTCAGIFAISFFQNRNLNSDGFKMELDFKWNKEKHVLEKVEFYLTLPNDFPEKYIQPLKQSIELCAVRKTLLNPPIFETKIVKN